MIDYDVSLLFGLLLLNVPCLFLIFLLFSDS